MKYFTKFSAALAVFALSTVANASEELRFMFPVTPTFSTPVGIVYPGLGAAGVVNPAILTTIPKTWSVYTANSIPFSGAGDYGVFGSIARTGKLFAASVGYTGTVGATTNHGFFGGIATRIDRISIGLSVLKDADPTVTMPRGDFVIMVPMIHSMHFAVKMEDAAANPRPVIGAGFRGDFSQFEANVRLPPLTNMTEGYEAVFATTLLFGNYSFHGAGSLLTISNQINYTFGLSKWLGPAINLSCQYSSNSRLTLGLSLQL